VNSSSLVYLVMILLLLWLAWRERKGVILLNEILRNQRRREIISRQCDIGDGIFKELTEKIKGTAYEISRTRKDPILGGSIQYSIHVRRKGGLADVVCTIFFNLETEPDFAWILDSRGKFRKLALFPFDPPQLKGVATDVHAFLIQHSIDNESSAKK
jgi:hypothetical protein